MDEAVEPGSSDTDVGDRRQEREGYESRMMKTARTVGRLSNSRLIVLVVDGPQRELWRN